MGLTANVLASGSGWRVQDVVCTFGPHDRPFAERHHGVCVAAVTEGTFQYRSTLGSAVLAPGALLLGNDHHRSNAAMSTAPATAVSRSVSRPNFSKAS